MRLLIYQTVNCMFFIFTDQSLKTLVMMICAGNKSNFFCSLFGKAEETMWQNYTQAYHNCSKKHRGLFSSNLFRFFCNCKSCQTHFFDAVAENITSLSKDISAERWFWLEIFGLQRSTTYQMSIFFAFYCQKSQVVIMDFVIFQSTKYHYKMDIQTWCVATGFKEGKIFFVLLESLLLLTSRSPGINI